MGRQMVVRVTDELHAELVAAAEASERTVAQEVRYRLRRALQPVVIADEAPTHSAETPGG